MADQVRVLFYADPKSVHEQKWLFELALNERIAIWLIGECDPGNTKQDYTRDDALIKRYEHAGIQVEDPVPVFSLTRIRNTHQSISRLNRIIKANRIDLVHFSFSTPHSLRAPFVNAPYMITTRGSDVLLVAPSLLKSSGIRGIHDRILFHLLKRAMKGAKRITSTSGAQIDKIRALYGDDLRSDLIRTGVPVDAIAAEQTGHLPMALQGVEFIFFPRYILPVYNLELQLDAIPELPQSIRERFCFVFMDIGKAEETYRARIRRKIESLPVKHLILGKLSQKEMWSCFSAASLAVMTPHSDGTPNTALEAFAAKCPLIVGDLTYDPALFNGTCIRLQSNTTAELADAITRAVNEYPRELVEHAFEKVREEANLHDSVQKITALYHSIKNGEV